MKFVYWVTRGASDPTAASMPLHLAANGSLEVGHDVAVILGGDATEIMVGDRAERIEGVGLPPMRELLAKLKAHQVPVYV